MNINEFIRLINEERKKNKDTWLNFTGFLVNGKEVSIEFFNTWNLSLKVNGWTCGGKGFLNVANWKKEIREAIKSSATDEVFG